MPKTDPFVHPIIRDARAEIEQLEALLADALRDSVEHPMRIEAAARLIGYNPTTFSHTWQAAFGLHRPPVTVDPDEIAAIYGRVRAGSEPMEAINAWLTQDVYTRPAKLA